MSVTSSGRSRYRTTSTGQAEFIALSGQAQQAREALGARLRELRKAKGLTGRAFAALAGWKLPKVSKIEHGHQHASENDIRIWCQVCGSDDELLDLIASARSIEAMWLEWRRNLHAGTRSRQLRSVALYERTTTFRVYHPSFIWGTLQTAEYAEAILRQVVDFYDVPDDVEQGVAARMERQQYLYRGKRRFHVLIGEQALYARVGDPTILKGQLDRLLATMSLPRLSLGVIPINATYAIWPANGFVMFDDTMVMVETYSAELTVNQPREIALYAKAFSMLQLAAAYGSPARTMILRALGSAPTK